MLRLIVILVAMAAGTPFALDHPRLPLRVLHVISPAQLEASPQSTGEALLTGSPRRPLPTAFPVRSRVLAIN